jgi:hypothetical protein
MIPRGSQGVANLAARIAGDLIPKAGDAYTGYDLGLIATLIGMVAQDYDRGAAVLAAEQAALTPILREAAARLDDADLKERIAAALALPPPGLRVSELTARSDLSLRLLIDAHAAVETAAIAGETWAHDLDAQIWRFLDAQAQAQAYAVSL